MTEPDGSCTIKIDPNAATKRTRTRVKKGGPTFDFYENTNRPGSILLRSPKTGWMGWLPLNEVKIEI